ncbi:hypothetical protein N836_20875 [Leptolyngbya sp. Heron Island J]|uniref:hypothetical protein n=1 Tax=Leptolyngbya sp. Heron Island J TaxID=1385935 RepID=UPI0003B9AF81|nr:hypothetical protein [Leptolyngbya sp. Heron Island J]ESA33627.1 hypothetical protein N836_20875 [Leptolyngbya sp. Heron Island J]
MRYAVEIVGKFAIASKCAQKQPRVASQGAPLASFTAGSGDLVENTLIPKPGKEPSQTTYASNKQQ